jgi:hypothetical protein
MSCSCTNTTEEETVPITKCNRDRVNNVWLEGANEDGEGGVCLLDTMSEDQVIYVLQRDEVARADLLRVTSDARLLELATIVSSLSKEQGGDQLQKMINRSSESIPFYSIFRGRPPVAR